MRIISGEHKGRKINAPKKLPVRPTTDMAKEALFNILNNKFYLDEITILDLYSGTGNISYEFASRGSKNIIAVDKDFGCINFIKTSAFQLKMPIQVIKSDVIKYLEQAKTQFNLIFADPPYALSQPEFEQIPQLIFKNKLLTEEGVLILEHSKYTNLTHCTNFKYSKKYGNTIFSFFENKKT